MITIPTLSALYNRVISAIETQFSDTAGRVLQALASVQAANLKLYYLAIGELQNNIWVDTCDDVTLNRFGLGWLGRLRFPATQGVYQVQVTGSVGAVIPASTTFRSNDDSLSPGYLYVLDNDYTFLTTTEVIYLRALTGGTISKLNVGDGLTATAPLLNVNQGGVVLAISTDPVDAESVALYRQKILDKIQLTAGSWSAIDYRLVGGEVAGVGQIYAYATSGQSNEVDVYIEGVSTDIPPFVPSGTVITNVTNAIELVRPLGVFQVNYAAVTVDDIEVTITMGSFPSFTSDQQATIEAALTEFINSVRPFIAACDPIADKNDIISSYNLAPVISNAVPGYGYSSVAFTVNGTPTLTYTSDNGNIPYLTAVHYA